MKNRLFKLVGLLLPLCVLNGSLLFVLDQLSSYTMYVVGASIVYYVIVFFRFMYKDNFYGQFFVFCCIVLNIVYWLYISSWAFGT